MMKRKTNQGAALVIALLVVSIITVLSVGILLRYEFMERKLLNQINLTQAEGYLGVAELIGKKALLAEKQLEQTNTYRFDHLAELWAQQVPPFLVEGGAYSGRLIDLQGKFNLNMLSTQAQKAQQGKQVPFTVEQGIFIRLLQSYNDDSLNISYDQAVKITQAVLDWSDADTQENFSYCEDDGYRFIENRKPHRTANQAFFSVSELRLICNFPIDLYIRIKEDLTVWPLSGVTTINVNTASEAVLASIIFNEQDVNRFRTIYQGDSFTAPSPIEREQLKNFIAEQQQGFLKWQQAISALSYQNFWPGAPLSLHSDYFLLDANVEFNGFKQKRLAVLKRTTNKVSTLFSSKEAL